MASKGYSEVKISESNSSYSYTIRVDTPNRTTHGVQVNASNGTYRNLKVFDTYVTFEVTTTVGSHRTETTYVTETEYRSITYSNSSPPAPSCASLPGWSLESSYTSGNYSRTCTYSRQVQKPITKNIYTHVATGTVVFDDTPNEMSGRVYTYEKYSIVNGAKGVLLGSVEAMYGAYPDSGLHGDGLWYEILPFPYIPYTRDSEMRKLTKVEYVRLQEKRNVVEIGYKTGGVIKKLR